MSEETKLAKFDVIVQETHTWLGRQADGNLDDMNYHFSGIGFVFQIKDTWYHPGFFDTYATNPYVEKILHTDYFDYSRSDNDIVQLVKKYKISGRETLPYFYERKTQRNLMIFWMLFLAALDDEIYNNELDSIIDIAYCMDFDEAMIRDWCCAVDYIMQGNRFSNNCNLECETEEGKEFFLHQH